jgi:DNA-directed RNA polymerase specialized sigma24 family protein
MVSNIGRGLEKRIQARISFWIEHISNKRTLVMDRFECRSSEDLKIDSQFCRNILSFCRSRGVRGQDGDDVAQQVAIDCAKRMSSSQTVEPGLVYRMIRSALAKHFKHSKRRPQCISPWESELTGAPANSGFRNPCRRHFMERLRGFRAKSREIYWHWLVVRESEGELINRFGISRSALRSAKQRLRAKIGVARDRPRSPRPNCLGA